MYFWPYINNVRPVHCIYKWKEYLIIPIILYFIILVWDKIDSCQDIILSNNMIIEYNSKYIIPALAILSCIMPVPDDWEICKAF